MWGIGCFFGVVGFMFGVCNGIFIFSFLEWGFVLFNVDDFESEIIVFKFCIEEIMLNNGFVGF